MRTVIAAIIVSLAGLVLAACGGSAAPQATHHRHPSVPATATPAAGALSAARACQRFWAAQHAVMRQVRSGPVAPASQRALASFGQELIHLGVLLSGNRPASSPR